MAVVFIVLVGAMLTVVGLITAIVSGIISAEILAYIGLAIIVVVVAYELFKKY